MKWFVGIVILITLDGCDEEDPEPTPAHTPQCYEKFLGNYHVYNTDSNNYYNMTISLEMDTSSNGNIYPALVYHKLANKLNIKSDFVCTVDSNGTGNFLNIGVHDTAYDYDGNRWYLFPIFQDSLNNKLSWLNNDTINLSFKMCNIAFYIYDGTPYYCKDVLHIAVKQH